MDHSRSLAAWIVGFAVLAGLGLVVAYLTRQVLLLIYISALFAIGLSPLVRKIETMAGSKMPRAAAVGIVYLVGIAVVAGILVSIVPSLVDQAQALWADLPRMFELAQQRLVSLGILGAPLTPREIFERVPIGGSDAVTTMVGAAFGVAGGLFGILTIMILTFYFLLESDSIVAAFVGLFPASRRSGIRSAAAEVTDKVSAWLTGQLMLAAIIGGSAALALGVLGVPYFYVLALVAGVGELIPVVGPILAAIPAVAVSMTQSFGLAASVAIFFLIQQQVENHLLVPKIMERQVGVSAVTVIVSLLLGGALLGLPGAILAIPTAAIVQVIYLYGRGDSQKPSRREA